VQGILLCLDEAFAPYRSAYTPEAFADTVLAPATLRDRMATMTILVSLTSHGEIAGTIAFCVGSSEHEGHLRGMAVREQWQSTGVATELLKHAEEELFALNCSRITLDTTLPLKRAMRFYEKSGYRRSGRTQDFFGMVLIEYFKNRSSDTH
jgi:GNAT superfamily N-acetyltransferase